ncbi:OmpA family protein [Microbacterium sp. SLBN-111]|uniref:OmpA family protein n=1 Tax=Microbacterium sp. SLBN-111 TaxID=3377733 RepID=UPI003C789948
MNRTIAALAASTTVAALLTGCAATPTSTTTPAACGEPAVKTDAPIYAVLAPTGETLTDVDADLRTVVDAATNDGAQLIVSGIGESAPSLIVDTVLVGVGENPLARSKDLACKHDEVTAGLDVLRGLAVDGTDVFGSISTFAGNVGDHATAQLVIFGGFAPAPALADPIGTINTLAAKGLMPVDCTGWTVSVAGPAAADPAVRDFWLAYVAKCGGTLAAVTTRLANFPSGTTVTASDRSPVEIDHQADVVTATVGGDVLFDYGSSTLSSGADPVLVKVFEMVSTTLGTVQITGHTDSRGTGNEALSLARGEAVRAWLVQHGVDPARIAPVRGAGASEPVVANAVTEAEHAANRRVTISVIPSA